MIVKKAIADDPNLPKVYHASTVRRSSDAAPVVKMNFTPSVVRKAAAGATPAPVVGAKPVAAGAASYAELQAQAGNLKPAAPVAAAPSFADLEKASETLPSVPAAAPPPAPVQIFTPPSAAAPAAPAVPTTPAAPATPEAAKS